MTHFQDASSLLGDLNPKQREAVEHVQGPLLILAGAGSGKTRVITYRIAFLIEICGVSPENILAVTFTNKAADQMKDRVLGLLQGKHSAHPLICTFHSLCVRILRREIEALDYSREFAIYDEGDQENVMRSCLKEVGLEGKRITPRAVLSQISHAKNHGFSPQQYYAAASDPRKEQVAVLYDLYEKKLRVAQALDFDDLLLRTVELLARFPEVRERYNQRFHYLLVDEYQDTNLPQYQLIRHLTQLRQNLCVVGDEDQSIYRWRGADIQNILNFERDFPDTRLIKLEQNYRSTHVILDAASSVVSNNVHRKGKSLWTERRGGDPIVVCEAADAEQEAHYVVDRILALKKARADLHFAVLYRTNAQSRHLEEACRRFGLSYRILGGFSFYDRAEIKDILSYLKLALNTEDPISFERIVNTPPRGIGRSTVEALNIHAREMGWSVWKTMEYALQKRTLQPRSLAALEEFHTLIQTLREKLEVLDTPELIRWIVEASGYRRMLEEDGSEESMDRIQNLEELTNAAGDSLTRRESLRDFLDHAALVSDQDDFDESAVVSLLTMHSAKGLEFPVVFVVGLEEGLFPHNRSLLVQEELEEERRLFYVAMTRAQNQLYLSHSHMRRYYGAEASERSEPSRFLSEIPPSLVEIYSERGTHIKPRVSFGATTYNSVEQIRDYLNARHKKPFSGQNVRFNGSGTFRSRTKWKSKFPLGSQVKHPKFGIGTVLRNEGEGDDLKLTVSFPQYGLKKLVEKIADLEKV